MKCFAKTYAELSLDELYEILRVRAEVFVVEQRCHYLDPDGVDRNAIHVGIRDDAGALVAYARMFADEGGVGVWHVGRVLAVRRGEGLGRRVMEEVERAAALRGAKLLRMEAQRQAAGFYARLGWRETGPDFDEAGIPHVRMEKGVQAREFFPMNIRPEQPSDYREVENLVRESFWNVYRPGALEHYVLHRLRDDPAFVRELDFVMEKDGRIVGQNVFVRAKIRADDGRDVPILTMGPICIAPDLKRQGYGKKLLDFSLERAAALGYGAVCFEGNIAFYGKSGFTYARAFGIRYHGLPEGADDSFFLCKELRPGYLDGVRGEYATPDGYFVCEKEPDSFAAFDAQFPEKEKQRLPGQLFDT